MSLSQIVKCNAEELANICFKINLSSVSNLQQKHDENDQFHYFSVKKKQYINNGQQKIMIQIRDVTQAVKFDQIYKENQFL